MHYYDHKVRHVPRRPKKPSSSKRWGSQGVEVGRMSGWGKLIGSLPTPPLRSGYWNVIRNASSLRTLLHFTYLPSSFPPALSSSLSPFPPLFPLMYRLLSLFILVSLPSSPARKKMIMRWKYDYKLYLPLKCFPLFIESKKGNMTKHD